MWSVKMRSMENEECGKYRLGLKPYCSAIKILNMNSVLLKQTQLGTQSELDNCMGTKRLN